MIAELIAVREKIKLLQVEESELVTSIIETAGHKKYGQATYNMDGAKVTIVTKENVTLDKKRLDEVWKETMPITRKYDYALRKADYDAMMESGTAAQRKFLAEIVTTKPAKPVIKVEV